MKKKNILILTIAITLCVICLIALVILIIKYNDLSNRMKSENLKNKYKVKKGELLCVGTYMDKFNEKSDKVFIYESKKNNFEIVFGDNSGNAIGTYEIVNNKEMDVVYKTTIFNPETNSYELGNKKIHIVQKKDCSAIVIDGIVYTKTKE